MDYFAEMFPNCYCRYDPERPQLPIPNCYCNIPHRDPQPPDPKPEPTDPKPKPEPPDHKPQLLHISAAILGFIIHVQSSVRKPKPPRKPQLPRRILAGIVGFIILVLLGIFLIWIILKPTTPRFVLQDATVSAFKISSPSAAPSVTAPIPNTLTITMQVRLSSFNPNERISIYYQKLSVYVSYRGQRISLSAELPPTYHDHGDMEAWSPLLCGDVPVSPYIACALQQDQKSGEVLVHVKVKGTVKWRVGS